MKELSIEKMEMVSGGMDCETGAGLSYGAAASLLIIGAATGGVGFLVAGGLTAYFGTIGTLACAMK